MQRKIKISIYTLLFAAILSVFAALLFVMPHSVSSVYAATNTSAVCTVKGRFEANNGQVIATTVKPESHFSITMESTNANGAGTLEYGTVINWANIIIKLNVVGGVKHLRFAITNAQDNIDVLANPLSGGGSLELFRGALSDGDYVLYYSSTITEGRNEYRGFIYRYRFTVDTTAPTNISKSDNVQINSGIQTTKSITYSATDEHLSRLYYKSPSASYFSSTTNSQYIVEPTKNNSGTWNFYAVDSVGNKSETVQVHLDCVPPAMTIANGMSFGTTVGDNITVTAYDNISSANGHKYVISSTPSTCTECEHVTYTCSLCGEKYEKEGNYPTGHSYIETVTVEPTCTTDGERKAVCEFCGDEYTTKINASGHTYEITDTSTKDGKYAIHLLFNGDIFQAYDTKIKEISCANLNGESRHVLWQVRSDSIRFVSDVSGVKEFDNTTNGGTNITVLIENNNNTDIDNLISESVFEAKEIVFTIKFDEQIINFKDRWKQFRFAYTIFPILRTIYESTLFLKRRYIHYSFELKITGFCPTDEMYSQYQFNISDVSIKQVRRKLDN